ncbi:hypothetical protein FAVG1_01594 [Fusarium avenaceum]|nr:hypothetical protein FAVG1_01594 [Fusarium avenaceum]
MTKIKLVRSGRECGADEQYYKCSYFDFEFRGCCSHDPCIKPHGCRDHDSVFVDTSLLASFSTIDMSDTETATSDTITSESTATESAAGSTTADRFGRETTFLTRTRPKAITTMDEDNEETSSTLKRTAHPKTMTDSGTTRTIPNSSRVTVTHITMIPTSKLPTTSREAPLTFVTSSATDGLPYPTASFESTPTGIPTQTSTVGPSLNDDSSGTPPIGIIVGGVVGGVVVLALVILAVFMVRRRRHNRELWVNGAGEYTFDEKEEKSYLRRMLSRNTTQRSQDPFAPFGGRIDRVDDPLRPPSGTFEMDGTSTVPVELPAVTFSDAKAKESQPVGHTNATSTGYSTVAGYVAPTQYPTATGNSVDPRANLNASLEDRQQKQFVNHWNQYRTLGENARQG